MLFHENDVLPLLCRENPTPGARPANYIFVYDSRDMFVFDEGKLAALCRLSNGIDDRGRESKSYEVRTQTS